HAALLHVRAADIQLEALRAGRAVEPRDDLAELMRLAPDDVDEDARAPDVRGDPRQVLAQHRVDAGGRESDGVDHAAGEVADAWRGSTLPRLQAHRLRHEPADRLEVHDIGELAPVRGGAGGEQDGILESQPGGLDLELRVAHRRATPVR